MCEHLANHREINRMKYSPERKITHIRNRNRATPHAKDLQNHTLCRTSWRLKSERTLAGTNPDAHTLESPIRIRDNAGRVPSYRIRASCETCWQSWQVNILFQRSAHFNKNRHRITYSQLTSTNVPISNRWPRQANDLHNQTWWRSLCGDPGPLPHRWHTFSQYSAGILSIHAKNSVGSFTPSSSADCLDTFPITAACPKNCDAREHSDNNTHIE